MKLSTLTLIIGAAGLAAAEANPTRFAVVKTDAQVNKPEVAVPMFHRVGLAGAAATVPTMANPIPGVAASPRFRHRPGCNGGFKAKATYWTNWLRIKLGLDKNGNAHIETTVVRVGHAVGPGPVAAHPHHAQLIRPIWTPPHTQASTFGGRIHRALTSLGPGEGRIVAFVLGCGIGVLLRMFWVLAILSVRAIRSRRESNVDYYSYEALERDGAEIEHAHLIFVAPPEYVDEKAPVSA